MTRSRSCATTADPVAGAGPARELGQLVERVCSLVERPTSSGFWLALAGSVTLLGLLIAALSMVTSRGIGVWGNHQTVGWACDITGFVFWIGIGHAGTLISAILYLFRQRWRTTINRAAEAMTLFAVISAAIFPVFHLGRVWLGYWLFPAPNQMLVWPNFKSPLTWDVFAISTYFLVSLMFWYLGLIPDLAALRDRAQTERRRSLLARLSLGWNGSQRHWQYYERAYLTLAGISTPLVVSVHTIVSFDFAVAIVPGWHSTLFPPYFVAGAILSGSAWVAVLLVLLRKSLGLKQAFTISHLEKLNQLVLATGTMVASAYLIEFYLAFTTGDAYERAVFQNRLLGTASLPFWIMVVGNVVLPQLFWSSKLRRSLLATVLIGLGVNVGMWLERYVIVTGSLKRGHLPSTWSEFTPTVGDVSMFVGSVGLFFTLLLLFLRYLPVLSLHELKADLHTTQTAEQESRVGHLAPETKTRRPQRMPLQGNSVVRSTMGQLTPPPLRDARRRLALVQGTTGPEPHAERLLGSCSDVSTLISTCETLHAAGLEGLDAYAPYPIPELHPTLHENTTRIARAALLGGLLGIGTGLALQYYAMVVGYPMMLGNKPDWSWQLAVPVTFELAVLFAAVGCFVEFLRACNLPNERALVSLRGDGARSSTDPLMVSVDCRKLTAETLGTLLNAGKVDCTVEVAR